MVAVTKPTVLKQVIHRLLGGPGHSGWSNGESMSSSKWTWPSERLELRHGFGEGEGATAHTQP